MKLTPGVQNLTLQQNRSFQDILTGEFHTIGMQGNIKMKGSSDYSAAEYLVYTRPLLYNAIMPASVLFI